MTNDAASTVHSANGNAQHRSLIVLGAIIICIATFITYISTLRAGFIWDDDDYITRNETLRSAEGLRRIWLEPGAVPQYYPLVHSMFWVEHKCWGLHPTGYHVVNIVLHIAGALLLWRVLTRLKLPPAVAWGSAAVFALHPVHVESVAWVTERKNVLSAALYFSAILAYLQFDPFHVDGPPRPRRWRWWFISFVLFIGALFSKTVTCSFPAAILLLTWWKRGRLRWNEIVPTLPMFVLGLAGGITTAVMEKYHVGAAGSEWDYSLLDRVLIAGRVVLFYAGKLLWPTQLAFVYARWHIDKFQFQQYLFPLVAVVIVLTLWLLRNRIGRGPLTAALFFGGTLFPALGFFDVYPFRYSFVADHFQYLASAGFIVLVVSLVCAAVERAGRAGQPLLITLGAVVLLLLSTLSYRQSRVYVNLETLWNDTLAKNPDSFMPAYNLAHELADQGRSQEAVALYRRALVLKPGWVLALNNLGLELAKQGDEARGMELFEQALQLQPDFIDAMNSLGAAYARQGNFDEAAEQFKKAISVNPEFVDARINLGVAYIRQNRPDEALAQFDEVLRIMRGNVQAGYNKAQILRDKGSINEAIEQLNRTAQLSPDDANVEYLTGQLLAGRGDHIAAIEHYQKAVALAPAHLQARHNLAVTLIAQGRPDEAIAQFQAIVARSPNDALASAMLASLLINAHDPKLRDARQAVIFADRACRLTQQHDPSMLATLAEAHALGGEWPQAAYVGQRAAAEARNLGEESFAQELDRRVKGYESHIRASDGSNQSTNQP